MMRLRVGDIVAGLTILVSLGGSMYDDGTSRPQSPNIPLQWRSNHSHSTLPSGFLLQWQLAACIAFSASRCTAGSTLSTV